MISTAKKDKDLSNPQPSRPIMKSFSRKLLSLDHIPWADFPELCQALRKEDATIWKWLSRPSPKTLALLINLPKKPPKIQKINIKYHHGMSLVRELNKQFSYLSPALQRLSLLRHLTLNLKECYAISDSGLYNICNGLSRIPLLESLVLCLKDSTFTDKGISKLGGCLQRLPNLKKLELRFRWAHKVSDIGLKRLDHCLRNMRKLESLSLDYSHNGNTTDSAVEGLSFPLKLKRLCLNFSYWRNITDSGINQIQKALEKLVLLEKVELKFKDCSKVTSVGFKYLVEGLKSLTFLKDITFYFSESEKIADSDIKIFNEVLKRMKYLENICVNFSKTPITDTGVGFLIGERRKTFKGFEVNFFLCPKITDLGIEKLSQGLKKLISLKTLNLNFNYCQEITDAGLISLSGALKKLASLENLKIAFGGCYKIKNEGFISFCESLKRLTCLRNTVEC